MEKRIIEEYRIFYLSLADMHGGVDKARPVVASYTLEELLDFYKKEREPWLDTNDSIDSYGNKHSWNKTFKKGSMLEWYNDVVSLEPTEFPSPFGGVGTVWVETANLNIPII